MDVNNAPTKGNLQQIQKTLRLSRNGYDLMDRKRLILMNEITSLIKEANKVQSDLDEAMKDAYAALQRASVDLGILDAYNAALDIEEDDDVTIQVRSIMGSEVPNIKHEAHSLKPAYAFSSTSANLDEARIAFEKVKELQIQLAQVENAAYRLANNIQKTQKRVNALQNITIPELEAVEKEINSALEEKEREEFIRLKVVKRILGNKVKAKAAEIQNELQANA
ncbi:MAG: V-type ATP synthase subunit D [Aerococcus sp.]|nr:V-type ATP synthase subunit D [Aerococcus sp.]